ncbi:hypothetical protein SAMN05216578_102273 [Halopseudomonas formosensis]|uniref:Helix-turn-helix domain-containing protein n=1 Tax=Halopseudomonas formosensis TaxID=1002526 RepID=A0A1I6ANT1_9GAMM|nr:hypothetical protein [Halopseudomonas formosensis]SFQ70345.1 hypothetical protein SAMN05216578_102273 [Halopseudomonas formosensis]
MRLRDYIKALDEEELAAYAARCSTTVNYLTTHILRATKDPSVRLMKRLASESRGNVTLHEVLEHYGLVDCPREAA